MGDPSQLAGQILGHYRILEQIGAGGMGVVYRARDEQLDRDVAVKVLPAGRLADETARSRFRKEALALAKLDHPNVATVFEFGNQNGVDFLVTAYIPGINVDVKLLSGAFPEAEVLSLAIQLTQGLTAAHSQGIIHRDLKPGNLRLTPDGRLKILDFGLARLIEPEGGLALTASLNQSRDVTGTLPYMAPEQLLNEKADARSDIWAAGAVLYEMATGQRPFPEARVPRLIEAILTKSPKAPAQLNPKLSPDLANVILKALHRDPQRRYQTAHELELDLERLSAGAKPLATTRRWLWPVVASAILGLLLVAIIGFLSKVRGAPALTEKDYILVTDFSNETGDPVFDSTLRKALALDLDQSPYLNVVSDQKVAQALKFMGRDPAEKLTPEVGTELCQRNGIKALLAGSIASIANDYRFGVQVIDAATGEVLAQDQERANGKDQVLSMVDLSVSKLRERLGESLTSIHKFDKPLPEATTSSLEALRAFALGDAKHLSAYEIDSIGLYKRALELDPKFALAWARLAAVYGNLGDEPDSEEAVKHAYGLKDRVSERERLYILGSSLDPSERRAGLELYRNTYPRDPMPYVDLSEFDTEPEGEKDLLQAIRLDPSIAIAYGDLAELYVGRGDGSKARQFCRDGLSHVPGSPLLAKECYKAALTAHDDAGLREATGTLEASPEGRVSLAELERNVAFARGQVRRSREINNQLLETLNATHLPSLALTKMLPYLRLQVAAGYKITVSDQLRAYPGLAAHSVPALLASAEAGEQQAAERLKSEVVKDNNDPSGKYVDALFASRRGQVNRAVALLQGTDQMEDPFIRWYKGSLYLRAGQRALASANFNALLEDAKPTSPLYPWLAFAHIGLARCYTQEGDMSKAHAEYEKAFAIWKGADLDIPLLQQAKEEYAKIH
jgi:eukaryotic-like serine/threonine-protein kinase